MKKVTAIILSILFFCSPAYAETVSYAVNMRDTYGELICCIYPGDEVEIIGPSDTYGRTDVAYNGTIGSILSDSLMPDNNEVTNIPIVSDSSNLLVDIDITNQTLSVQQGDDILFQTFIVSGTQYYNETPIGNFEIYQKTNGCYLSGYNADGTQYHCWVDYWMPFYEGYGIHDASWRSEFGGDIYQYSGSHGCVNLPQDVAKTVFNLVNVGTPVYIHY